MNKKQEAESSYLKALQLFNELNNLKQKSITLNNLGILKFEAKQFDVAKKYFTQSLEIAEKLNDHELAKPFVTITSGQFMKQKKITLKHLLIMKMHSS
jgi:Tfp pilus assembly protein PilF